MSDRREFLSQLMAGSVVGLPAVKSAEVLRLRPKDTLVLTCDGAALSDKMAHKLKSFMEEKFPGQRILVLERGLDVKVIREDG